MDFNNIYQGLISGKEKLALVGLGYVGMPIAVEFAKHIDVIGFDINEKRVYEYQHGIDSTNEVGEAIRSNSSTKSLPIFTDKTDLSILSIALLASVSAVVFSSLGT